MDAFREWPTNDDADFSSLTCPTDWPGPQNEIMSSHVVGGNTRWRRTTTNWIGTKRIMASTRYLYHKRKQLTARQGKNIL